MALRTHPSASLWENLRYNLFHVLPEVMQGTFTRRRFWVGFWTLFQRDPGAVRFLQRLRKKYGNYFWIRLGTTRSLVVLDTEGVQQVLQHSPTVFADGKPKRDGMSVFQPRAVTISRGRHWEDRRSFNESVLGTGKLHPLADHFLGVIRHEIKSGNGGGPPTSWDHFDALFARVMRTVIFGVRARDDTNLTDLLRRMMGEANRLRKPLKSQYFEPFYARVRTYLNAPDPNSLMARCANAPATELTRMENQIPHWMFAMWETLAINTVRTLSLIVSHPEVEQRLRQDANKVDVTQAAGVDSLTFLECCMQEAMRLWPSTPMLVRQTVQAPLLGGIPIPRDAQVLILNSFNHRDSERDPQADRFTPQQWLNGTQHPLFNHMSSGTQVCAGKSLALFMAKAMLITLLAENQFRLVSPYLHQSHSLPRLFNHYRVRFDVSALKSP